MMACVCIIVWCSTGDRKQDLNTGSPVEDNAATGILLERHSKSPVAT